LSEPETAQADHLPFAAFLEDLRRRGLAIGVREYELFYKLLARFEGDRVSDLRDAIAALLARNQAEVVLVRRVFDDTLAVEPAPVEPPRVRPRRIWPWAIAATAVIVAIAAGVIYRELTRPPVRITEAPPPPPPLPPGDPVARLPARPPPPEPAIVGAARLSADLLSARWPYALLFGTASLALLALVGLRRSHARDEAMRDQRRARLAAVPGPQHVRLVAPPYRGLGADALDDFATWISRIPAERLPARRLDIDGTVHASARDGRPVLVFADRPPGRVLVVLEDVGPEMRPWRRKLAAFATGLEQRGVLVERWMFDTHAVTVRPFPHGTPVPLAALTGAAEGRMLIVVSTGMGILGEGRVLNSWVRELAAFSSRVWLNPIGDEALWRGGLARAPMPVLPLTATSLAQAARALGADVPDASVRPRAAAPVTGDPVDEVRQIAALYPAADLELVMWLTETFLPHVPEATALAVHDKHGAWGRRLLRWQPGERAAALGRLRREHPDREREVRRRLLGLFDSHEPPANTAAHLRWRLARAEQAAFLADPAEAAPVQRELAELVASPLGEETDELLAVLRATPGEPATSPPWKRPARTIGTPAPAPARRELSLAGPRRHALRAGDLVRALAAGIVVVGVATLSRPSVARTPNLDGAYELGVDEATSSRKTPSLIVRSARPDSPGIGDVLRDGEPLATYLPLRAAPLLAVDRGHWYQLRARTSTGAWALSQQLFVPAEYTATGTLLVALIDEADNRSLDPRPITVDGSARASGGVVALPVGDHEVIVDVAGYQAVTRRIAVEEDNPALLRVPLRRQAAPTISLALSIPSGVAARDVLINGAPWDGRPIAAAAGDRIEVELADPRFELKRTFTVTEGQRTLVVQARPSYGILVVERPAGTPADYEIAPPMEEVMRRQDQQVAGRLTRTYRGRELMYTITRPGFSRAEFVEVGKVTRAAIGATATAQAQPFVLHLLAGTVNGVGPRAGMDAIKRAFPHYTGSTDDPVSNYGGGVFFANHQLYFYTARRAIQARAGFDGKVIPGGFELSANELVKRLSVSRPFFRAPGLELYEMKYGCLELELSGSAISEITMHGQRCASVKPFGSPAKGADAAPDRGSVQSVPPPETGTPGSTADASSVRVPPVTARIIGNNVRGNEVLITIAAGMNAGVGKDWRGTVLRADTNEPLAGGEVTILRIDKAVTVGSVRLTADQLADNARVRLSAPTAFSAP
jgi:hypothetical protein